MKNSRLIKSMLLVTGVAVLASGCVVRERTVYRDRPPAAAPAGGGVVVDDAPPPVVEEQVTVAPGPEFVWIGGVWVWHGRHWAWENGHWARPPHPGAVW